MARYRFYEVDVPQYVYPRKRYGFGHLLFDFVLTMATGGLWLLWLVIKFLRNGSR